MQRRFILFLMICFVFTTFKIPATAQQTTRLADELKTIPVSELAEEAARFGDPNRGALLFFKPEMTCAKCHDENAYRQRLAPDLAAPEKDQLSLNEHLIESLLFPSKKIRKGFESAVVLTTEGKTISGVLVDADESQLVIADPSNNGDHSTIALDDVEEWKKTQLSTMPEGLANLLGSKSEFLDLAAYVIEIASGGPRRALELRPADSMFALAPIPEYENRVDHAKLISSLNAESLARGKEIYEMRCINCHGTINEVGSLPTSLRFGEGRFKNGSDLHSMYKTLTHGYGMMVRQSWLVPQQKYEVIQYIREHFLKEHNPTQYMKITKSYLESLPAGDTLGPQPIIDMPWKTMNYGPVMMNTIEVGNDGDNFAYKGIAVRLDQGEGGVAYGNHWMLFDHDTMRVAAVWSATDDEKFIDWRGIHFDGRHNIHPRAVGAVQVNNPIGPGWAKPGSKNDFQDNERIVGRDKKTYGPLPGNWSKFEGRYDYQDKTVLKYMVGEANILEMPGIQFVDGRPVFTRTFQVGPHAESLTLQVAHETDKLLQEPVGQSSKQSIILAPSDAEVGTDSVSTRQFAFDGSTYAQLDDGSAFDLTSADFTIAARIKTEHDGTIFCKTENSSTWVPDGKSFFVRDGRLVFDIGWVGSVQSRQRVNDGAEHHVAMTWSKEDGQVKFYIDGRLSGSGELAPKAPVENHVVRIGFTAKDFPATSFFDGAIEQLQFFQKRLDEKQILELADKKSNGIATASWLMGDASESKWPTEDGKHTATIVGSSANKKPGKFLMAAVSRELEQPIWNYADRENLRLTIEPNTAPVTFTLFLNRAESVDELAATNLDFLNSRSQNLDVLVHGGPQRWPEILETKIIRGRNDGPFAVDILVRPEDNPWNCRLRLTGIDFFDDANVAAVSCWDGSVFLVRGLLTKEDKLTWQRIASGLFQPLGIKVIDEKIFVSCRDQLVKLHDLDGDEEIDFYECINNDHQVTEHFHEFAMGLQTDDDGNFYYAKSARHALPALVPHHGTLLKVLADGSKTEIVANGFRAANGVCINDDGSFFVTDQEGHWTPKNRINRVVQGRFYGNMLGFHDRKDESDQAMEQPLVWITNQMDRSPGELLWVDSEKWGELNGRLLNLSYGMGQIFVVPHEKANEQWQGGVVALPLPPFPTGIMRGRFHPIDQQLYCCGMFAWSSNQQEPGGLYRVRATGKPMNLPVELKARPQKLTIKFTDPIEADSASDLGNWSIKTWDLKRSSNYGSDHLNEQRQEIVSVQVVAANTVELTFEELKPSRCMEIRYSLESNTGQRFRGTLHNSIHEIGNDN